MTFRHIAQARSHEKSLKFEQAIKEYTAIARQYPGTRYHWKHGFNSLRLFSGEFMEQVPCSGCCTFFTPRNKAQQFCSRPACQRLRNMKQGITQSIKLTDIAKMDAKKLSIDSLC